MKFSHMDSLFIKIFDILIYSKRFTPWYIYQGKIIYNFGQIGSFRRRLLSTFGGIKKYHPIYLWNNQNL